MHPYGGGFVGTIPGLIKSVQRGSISIAGAFSATATISAIVLANSLIVYGGHTTDDAGTTMPVTTAAVELTNTTTVTASNGLNSGTQIVAYEVIEFYPGVLRSVQRGTISVGGAATSVTATITSVDITKASAFFLGYTIAVIAQNNLHHVRVVLTNSTTVTATVAAVGGGNVAGYQVVEFF